MLEVDHEALKICRCVYYKEATGQTLGVFEVCLDFVTLAVMLDGAFVSSLNIFCQQECGFLSLFFLNRPAKGKCFENWGVPGIY